MIFDITLNDVKCKVILLPIYVIKNDTNENDTYSL